MFDYLVFIGRFQPFHRGHESVIRAALEQSREVIVLLGSTRSPRNTRNPFTLAERTCMIKAAFSPAEQARIHCVGLADVLYNDTRWVNEVRVAVASIANPSGLEQPRIGLIGHNKDPSSYYLSLFPHWDSVAAPTPFAVSATPIRQAYLQGQHPSIEAVPQSTLEVLTAFSDQPVYQTLCDEAQFVEHYKQQWANAPYLPTFVTADAVIVQSGHVLLIERKAHPGKGLWALPGGFVDGQETLLDACIREVREETRLEVPEPVLRGSLQHQMTFDDPHRSARGRTITQAFYFALPYDPVGLPKVKGGDDATAAFWVPLAEVVSERCFDDHYAIIQQFIG